jgi:hypothetical protein
MSGTLSQRFRTKRNAIETIYKNIQAPLKAIGSQAERSAHKFLRKGTSKEIPELEGYLAELATLAQYELDLAKRDRPSTPREALEEETRIAQSRGTKASQATIASRLGRFEAKLMVTRRT